MAERGLLNAVFLADSPSLSEQGGGDGLNGPTRSLDPVVIVAAMALATEKLGFILTSSTTFNLPYNVARQIGSLDHLSKGRIGWNIVTTSDPGAGGNFGLSAMPDNDTRYGTAAEFTDVVLKLWDSWEDGALIGDPRRVCGPTAAAFTPSITRAPTSRSRGRSRSRAHRRAALFWCRPAARRKGRNFASKYAEAIFTVQTLKREALAYYADIKSRARAHGRNPDKIAILPGLSLVMGSTEAEAHQRLAELDAISNDSSALERFAKRLGVDPAELDFDRPFPEHLIDQIKPMNNSTGHKQARTILLRERTLTVREIIARGSGGHHRVVGSHEQVADFIEDWFTTGAADGFNLFFDMYPASLATFVDHVIPILQRRGLYWTEYTGSTLRGPLRTGAPGQHPVPRPPSNCRSRSSCTFAANLRTHLGKRTGRSRQSRGLSRPRSKEKPPS